MHEASDAGYTLAEMIAALLIVGLAMGGAFQASAVLEHQQRSALRATRILDAEHHLTTAFADLLTRYRTPASGERDLEGDATGFTFACETRTCGAQLALSRGEGRLQLETPTSEEHPLGAARDARFVYLSDQGRTDSWPVASSKPMHLYAVLLESQLSGEPLHMAVARVWRQEPAGCRFDVIARACRTATP